jgi:PRC-barrel domain
MFDDINRGDAPRAGQQLAQGAPVYDVNGDKVGTVADVDRQNSALVIQKGLFFPKDIPVPMSAIVRADADGVYLNRNKDDVIKGNFANTRSAGERAYATDTAVDTQTPYAADPARSVGDRDLGNRAASYEDNAGVMDASDRAANATGYDTDLRRAERINDTLPTANP